MRHDFAGVVERMERLRAPLEYAWGVMSHLTGVKNSDPLRDAHQELQVSRGHDSAFFLLGFRSAGYLGVVERTSPRGVVVSASNAYVRTPRLSFHVTTMGRMYLAACSPPATMHALSLSLACSLTPAP